jgi:hypothetical protein
MGLRETMRIPPEIIIAAFFLGTYISVCREEKRNDQLSRPSRRLMRWQGESEGGAACAS